MTRLIVQNAARIVTMDAGRRELARGAVLVEDGVIAAVGDLAAAEAEGAEILDAGGCVVTPGLVNTHHHLYQCLTRAVPAGQDALLFGWLQTLYPIWGRMTPDDMRVSAQLGLAELALSGCSMSSDHLYLFPNGVRLEDTIDAAAGIGIRFHPDPRGDERRRERRRPAARQPRRARARDPRRHDPRRRRLPRSRARRHGPRRPRALLALLGLDRAHGRRRRARPRQGR